jgi:hypothetical protein
MYMCKYVCACSRCIHQNNIQLETSRMHVQHNIRHQKNKITAYLSKKKTKPQNSARIPLSARASRLLPLTSRQIDKIQTAVPFLDKSVGPCVGALELESEDRVRTRRLFVHGRLAHVPATAATCSCHYLSLNLSFEY